ncbi:MAG TPA: non-canonical purine NTP pyrophosphatase, partial [Saprospiraceae bacterium]|nr:non-canonical purine NTP pyrophosphatase [Saprospiraceae bacterium]
YSARYAGTQRSHADNINLLLKNLEGHTNRNARFKTVIALTFDKQIYYFEGTVNGRIAYQPSGNAGFGYDPIFIPDGYDQSFGELPAEVKNQISHRAIAVEKLLRFLQGK